MHKMHHRIENDNLPRREDCPYILDKYLALRIEMSFAETGDWVMKFDEEAAASGLLPKNVRFLGKSPTPFNEPSTGLYEFEVVKGNAAYREGERFYLTPAQAQRAYQIALLA
jgi:hypothetical protein